MLEGVLHDERNEFLPDKNVATDNIWLIQEYAPW